MPFTFAHPAIVLPLYQLPKRLVSLTALIIGSMIPDFEYFIRMKLIGIYGHSVGGLFWFDLPLGLLIYFVYQRLIKNTLIDHLPVYLNGRFSAYKSNTAGRVSVNSIAIIAICLLIGSASHLFWDGFTHKQRFFAVHFPVFTSTISVAGHPVFVYKLLQHSSTVLGFSIIGYAITRLPSGEATGRQNKGRFWICVLAIMLAVLAIKTIASFNIWGSQGGFPYGEIIVTAISGFLLGLLLVCGYMYTNKKGPIAGAF
nr:DUF4184 family protein [uncultured Mucilaginibacter sp.]